MILDIIFVRHGISCGNAWAHTVYGVQTLYPDPELTKSGVKRSKELSASLIKKIDKQWKKEPFTICSSQMIRAQETAFYMLSLPLGKPINVIPHVGETGFTRDNYSLPQVEQLHIIMDRNPAVADMLIRGRDGRLNQTLWNKANLKDFIGWASAHPEFFAIGSDGHYRAVIFTHSNFIKSAFNMDTKINNNEAVHTIINTSKSESQLQYTYMPNPAVYQEFINECHDECLVSPCLYESPSQR